MPEIDFRRTPVTLLLAAVIVAIELVSTLDGARRAYFADDLRLVLLSYIWAGEIWRPFTTTIIHGDFLHAAFNVYWLFVFGRALEPYLGSLRYALLIGLLAYGASMTSFLIKNVNTPLNGQIAGVGFSGVVYGLFGLLWVGQRWRPEFRYVCPREIVMVMIGWFFLAILLTHAGAMRIDNTGHAAGLGLGALYAAAAYAPRHRRLYLVAAIAVSAVLLVSVVNAPGHPLYVKYTNAMNLRKMLGQ